MTQSRGLARLIEDNLQQQSAKLLRDTADVKIKISGCPNGCGQHHVAAIGFQGSIRKLGDRVVPQYFLMLGGGAGQDAASFGRLTAKIPARRVPEAVDRLLKLYEEEHTTGETAPAFFHRVDLALAKAAVADLERDDRPRMFCRRTSSIRGRITHSVRRSWTANAARSDARSRNGPGDRRSGLDREPGSRPRHPWGWR